nr:unnamed protein product [Callosobruchus chinensis]
MQSRERQFDSLVIRP